jgi:antitoxin VapB
MLMVFRSEALMITTHQIKIVRLGGRQTFQLPPEFELPGDEAEVYKEADRVIIRPIKRKTLRETLATLEPLDEKLPEIDDPPVEPEDIF